MIDREYTIRSPELIEFHYPLAGLGTRFFALLIDTGCIIGAYLLISIITWILAALLGLATRSLGGTNAISAIAVVAGFVLQWAYFIFFDMYWNGQTPGKKAMRIRVIRDDGGGITLLQSTVRNLLRLVDGLPLPAPILYVFSSLVGGGVIFFSSENRRLGDYVAGTIVVRDPSWRPPRAVVPAHGGQNTLKEDRRLRRRLEQELDKPEKELLLDLSLRGDQLDLGLRMELMSRTAEYLQRRLKLQRPQFMSEEKFIINIAGCLYEDQEEAADRLGWKRRGRAPGPQTAGPPMGTER